MALDEPLTRVRAKELILAILESGRTSISAHALDEMDADGLDGPDVLEVLERGWVESCRLEDGSWRIGSRTARPASSSPSARTAHAPSSPHGGIER